MGGRPDRRQGDEGHDPAHTNPSGAPTHRPRWVALYVLCVGMLMIVLDATVVNVALPAIQDDLDFSPSSLAWVVNAYLIAFGGLLLLAGRLGDLVGRRSVFLAGLAVFTGASLLCGAAQTREMLVGARFLQGIGGAMTSAVILGMIVTMFPEPREQAKAIGSFAFVASAGGAVGLLVGGVLTESINWHWIFFVNVPIGIVTGVLATRLIERDEGIGFGRGADVPGAVLVTGALMLGVYTIVEPAARLGWVAGPTLALGALSLALLAAFVARQATAADPLMPLRVFRSRNVAGANVVQVLTVAGMFGMFFLGALYLQRVLSYDPLETGLAFLPVTVIMGTLSVRYTDRLVMRFGARTLVLVGLTLFMGGLALFTRAPVDGDYLLHVLPVMTLLGTGAGLPLPGAHDARDVGRHGRRRRAGVRVDQHDRAGGRRARARRARDPRGVAQRADGRGGLVPGRGARQWLPPRVRPRGRVGGGGHRRGRARAAAGARGRARGAEGCGRGRARLVELSAARTVRVDEMSDPSAVVLDADLHLVPVSPSLAGRGRVRVSASRRRPEPLAVTGRPLGDELT